MAPTIEIRIPLRGVRDAETEPGKAIAEALGSQRPTWYQGWADLDRVAEAGVVEPMLVVVAEAAYDPGSDDGDERLEQLKSEIRAFIDGAAGRIVCTDMFSKIRGT